MSDHGGVGGNVGIGWGFSDVVVRGGTCKGCNGWVRD